MLKSFQCLFVLLLGISVLTNPVMAKGQSTSSVSTKHQTLKLYKGYFPYQVCLLVTINEVIKKQNGILLLTVTIEDVYRGNHKKGSALAVSLYGSDAGPESFRFLSALRSTRQIIAFNHWTKSSAYLNELTKVSQNPIKCLWIPYAQNGFQLNDIAQIKALIKDSPTQPSQAKAAFQRFLEKKWPPARINDFCRPETQRTYIEATEHAANYKTDWNISPMHINKVAELAGKTVEWQASVDNNTPTWYNVLVCSPDKDPIGWDLEVAQPSLEEWTDDNYLTHRVGYSINQAAWAHWQLNHELHPASTEYRHLILSRSGETLVKDKTGKATSYQCRLGDGTTLTAILTVDKSQAIERILINGKLDPGWTDMYKNNLNNIAKCRDILRTK